jgi:hypothetical protein
MYYRNGGTGRPVQRCRADGTGREQGDNKEQYHEHASISGRGEEAVLETKFF